LMQEKKVEEGNRLERYHKMALAMFFLAAMAFVMIQSGNNTLTGNVMTVLCVVSVLLSGVFWWIYGHYYENNGWIYQALGIVLFCVALILSIGYFLI